jgi:hypothetical protein
MRLSDPGCVEWDVRLTLVRVLAVPSRSRHVAESRGPFGNRVWMKPDSQHLLNWECVCATSRQRTPSRPIECEYDSNSVLAERQLPGTMGSLRCRKMSQFLSFNVPV